MPASAAHVYDSTICALDDSRGSLKGQAWRNHRLFLLAKFYRLIVIRDRAVVVTLSLVGIAAVEVGRGVCRIKFDRLIVVGNCLVVVPFRVRSRQPAG